MLLIYGGDTVKNRYESVQTRSGNFANKDIDFDVVIDEMHNFRSGINVLRAVYDIKESAREEGNWNIIMLCDYVVECFYNSNMTEKQLYRVVLYISGFSYKEIAKIQGVHTSTVRDCVHLGYKKIIKSLDRTG